MRSDRETGLRQFEDAALPYLSDLYRTARRLVYRQDEAEDLVQETYLQAWKSFHRFAPGTNCRAWLFKILSHVIHHYWRKQSHVKVVDESEELLERVLKYEPPIPETITDEEILAALARVPQVFREVVLLADVEELSYKEIARILAVPLGTVMSRINRGRNILRNELLKSPIGTLNGIRSAMVLQPRIS